MADDRWSRIEELYHSALDHEPEQRTAFLAAACAGDEMLEREVQSLLASHQDAGSFLENPALELAARALALKQDHQTRERSGFLIGRTISHYRIIEKLGGGGMGIVYKPKISGCIGCLRSNFFPTKLRGTRKLLLVFSAKREPLRP